MTTEKQAIEGNGTGAPIPAGSPPELPAPGAPLSGSMDSTQPGGAGGYLRAWLSRVRSGDAGNLPVIAGLVVIVVIFQTQNANFVSAANFANLLTQTSYFVLFGMAEVFVLLLGEIDLSVGYNAACGAAVMLILNSQLHAWPWWGSVLAGFAFCSLLGLVQGAIITRLRVPSFVVTLGGLLAFEGVLLYILDHFAGAQTGGTVQMTSAALVDIEYGQLSPALGWIITSLLVAGYAGFVVLQGRRRRVNGLVSPPRVLQVIKVAGVAAVAIIVVAVCNLNRGRTTPIRGVPISVYLLLGIVVAFSFLLSRTRFGRYVYAVGGNAEAARRAGIQVNRIRLLCFVLAGFMAGVAGLFYASYIESVSQAIDGGTLVLYAVAAAVIGGTSLFGGRGKMVHAVLGGLVIAIIYNGMGLLDLGADIQYMVTALVLVAAATVDAVARKGRVAS